MVRQAERDAGQRPRRDREPDAPHRRRAQLTYTSATNTGQNATLYSTPLRDKSALDVTSRYFQDSYSLKRLAPVGGVRYERLEGYLPEQASEPSIFFPNLQREFAAVRDVLLWHTAGPRFSAIYDLQGDG